MKSWGTEGRLEGDQQIPPSDHLHACVNFRGEDIKDLHVHEVCHLTHPCAFNTLLGCFGLLLVVDVTVSVLRLFPVLLAAAAGVGVRQNSKRSGFRESTIRSFESQGRPFAGCAPMRCAFVAVVAFDAVMLYPPLSRNPALSAFADRGATRAASGTAGRDAPPSPHGAPADRGGNPRGPRCGGRRSGRRRPREG